MTDTNDALRGMPVCRDCHWCKPALLYLLLDRLGLFRHQAWLNAKCTHPAAQRDLTPYRNLDMLVANATRREVSEPPYCAACRVGPACGEIGKLWEPRR